MDKLTAILVTIVGILLILPLLGVDIGVSITDWIVALAVLIIGIPALIKSFK